MGQSHKEAQSTTCLQREWLAALISCAERYGDTRNGTPRATATPFASDDIKSSYLLILRE